MGPRGVSVEKRVDGSLILRCPTPLREHPQRITERMLHWAEQTPDAIAFAQRYPDGRKNAWMTLSYREFAERFRRIGQALIERKLSPDRPVMLLSENDFENGLLHFAAMHVGVPYIPVSPNYSLLSRDHAKLKSIMQLMNPGLVFAADGGRYGAAILAAAPPDAEIVCATNPPPQAGGRRITSFAELLDTPATSAVDDAFAKVGPDTIGKILFTSGSTGAPKGVVHNQRHICCNCAHNTQFFPFLEDHPPVIVDWLPWHHVSGGTHNIGSAVWTGGSYYIDHGKPLPGQIDSTVQALREVAQTYWINVPKGMEAVLPYLRSEPELRKTFFSRLEFIHYVAASLPGHIWDAIDELAVQETGERILISAGLGSTECGPTMIFANWEPPKKQPVIGLPLPGVEAKLVPHGEKLEIRFRAPCVTAGYWKNDELNRQAFDEEGFIRTGDAVKFWNPDHPEEGLMFNGRITEDFKLTSGSWVNVMALRNMLMAHFAPYLFDVVIAGHNQDYVCGLVFPAIEACRALCPELPESASAAEVVASVGVRAKFQLLIDSLARVSTGGTTHIARIVLESDPPTLDNGEMADKGTVAQRMVLERRAAVVSELYEEPPPGRLLVAASS